MRKLSLRIASATLAIFLVLTALPLRAAELVQNGSFESGMTQWSPIGAGVTLALDADAHSGTRSILVTTRSSASAAVKQNIGPALTALGSGSRIVTRCWIKLAVPSSVRLRLNLATGGGSSTFLLAERMVMTANQWTEIVGSATPTWPGTLTQALLYCDIGEDIEPGYSDCRLDDFSILPDSDGDHLSDAAEQTLGSNSADPDSDGDGMDDDWEVTHHLNPLVDDRDDDVDGDSYTNGQEYYAATDPENGTSQPGIPSDSQASAATQALLRYLALLPSRDENRVLLGQMMIAAAETAQSGYDHNILGLYNGTGKWPALMAMPYEDVNAPLRVDTITPFALNYWNQGGLILIKWAPFNPWTLGSNNDQTAVDLDLLLVPGDPGHETFVDWLDQIAVGLGQLQDAGAVVLWRPMSEMNGSWFWWGHRSRDQYVAIWRFMHDYLTQTKGLHNLLWVYESDSGVHDGVASDYYYPGDDVVDIAGHNLYDDDWDLPFEANKLFANYPKPYAFPQAGSKNIRDGSFDNLIYTTKLRQHYPRCSFFAPWASNPSNSRYNAVIDNLHPQELVDDDWILTREELDWQTGGALSILSQQGAGSYCEGQSVSLTVAASGSGSLQYQWYKDGASVNGAVAATLELNPALAGDTGDYHCLVTDQNGSLASPTMTVTIDPGFALDLHGSAAAAGLQAITLDAWTACDLPQLTYSWSDVDSGQVLGQGPSTAIQPNATLHCLLTAHDPLTGNTRTRNWTIVVSANPNLRDLNDDHSNSLADLWLLCAAWETNDTNLDADGDGHIDVRDLCYVNLDTGHLAAKSGPQPHRVLRRK